jgi:hypothetical protein
MRGAFAASNTGSIWKTLDRCMLDQKQADSMILQWSAGNCGIWARMRKFPELLALFAQHCKLARIFTDWLVRLTCYSLGRLDGTRLAVNEDFT